MATTFVDIDRGRLLDVVPGRSGQVVREWVASQPCWWADRINVAAIDAFRGYATAIGDVLPAATLVIDHFHAIRLASEAVNDVRRRVQQEQLGHRGGKHDPLYGIRRLLLRTWGNLNERGWERLRAGLAAGDPDGEVAAVWLASELLAEVYTARDLAHAKRRGRRSMPSRWSHPSEERRRRRRRIRRDRSSGTSVRKSARPLPAVRGADGHPRSADGAAPCPCYLQK